MINQLTPYVPISWLKNGHLQTILCAKVLPRLHFPFKRHRISTPDHDFIDLNIYSNTQETSSKRILVIFHGLEGNDQSHYLGYLVRDFLKNQFQHVVFVHFRGCSGEMNLTHRAYFAGDYQEIYFILSQIQHLFQGFELNALGVSLGGNALLRFLAKLPHHANSLLNKAIIVSAPIHLLEAGQLLDKGLNRWIYARHFLSTLKPKMQKKWHSCEALKPYFDLNTLKKIQTIQHFDDLITSRIHGFKNVWDYWKSCSTLHELHYIQTPTLIIHAENDPILPLKSFQSQLNLSPNITFFSQTSGGHVGFLTYRQSTRQISFDWLGLVSLEFLNHFNKQ